MPSNSETAARRSANSGRARRRGSAAHSSPATDRVALGHRPRPATPWSGRGRTSCTFWPRRVTSTTPSSASASTSPTSRRRAGADLTTPTWARCRTRRSRRADLDGDPGGVSRRLAGPGGPTGRRRPHRVPSRPRSRGDGVVAREACRRSTARWTLCVPSTTSTWPARSGPARGPSGRGTPPPRSAARAGLPFTDFRWPRLPYRRLSAFSRMQQVFKTTTSASSSPDATSMPSASSRPAMRSESCSFIWHPKVRSRYLRAHPHRLGGRGRRQ